MPPKKSVRAAPPAHYTLKIECFSLLEEKPGEMIRYESNMFEVGGYKWKLFLYPKGHTDQGGEGYLSLYLAIVETQTHAAGWEVSVNSKMFVFNHSDDKFLTVEDDKAWRFHKLKTEWGIPHLISLDDLHDASRGFLSGDSFICGIEIYPVKHNGKGENVSLVKNPQGGTYTWKISNLSDKESIPSDEFDVGGHKWQLQLYPKGHSSSNGESLSLYLNLLDAANCLPREKKIYVKFNLRIKGQNGAKNHWKQGYKKSVRIAPPAHLKLKIGCFSLFSDKKIDRYESDMFEIGGYKWILCLYPSGYSQEGGKDYLSLYLAIAETQTLPPAWDVTVCSKLFVFNHIDGDFLTIQDDKAWRFHELKTEWGIPRLISLTDLHDASRGFLYKDSFICGVEIYPIKHNSKGESLSLIKNPKGGTYAWKISNFSAKVQRMCSPEFTVGGYKWNIEINPNGKLAEHLSFYLNLIDAKTSLPPGVKVYIKYISRMKNQLGKKNHINTATHWFSSSSASWGFIKYIKSSVLNDLSEGYLKDDSIVPEVEFIAMSHLTLLP